MIRAYYPMCKDFQQKKISRVYIKFLTRKMHLPEARLTEKSFVPTRDFYGFILMILKALISPFVDES